MVKRVTNATLLIFLVSIISICFISASISNLGTFKQNSCIGLFQTCSDCSFNNITSVSYPNGTQALGEVTMTKVGTVYNYTFCLTDASGTYNINGFGDASGVNTIWSYTFIISPNGLSQTTSQGLGSFSYMFLILALTVLFGWLGFKCLDSNYIWVLGIFFLFLSCVLIVYDVWLGYEYSLNYTGTAQATMAGIIFYIFLFLLVAGISVSLILLFTKFKKIKEWYRKIKEDGERESEEDDMNWN